MKNYFIKEDSVNHIFYNMTGSILALLTFMLSFKLFYEYFYEHFYWHNRKLLYKKLKSNELLPINKNIIKHNLIEYELNDYYKIRVYSNKKLTLHNNRYEYIGQFTFSPIMVNLNKKIINLLSEKYKSSIPIDTFDNIYVPIAGPSIGLIEYKKNFKILKNKK